MTNTKIKILTGANAFSPSALKKLTTAFNSHNKTSAIFHAKEVFLIQSKNDREKLDNLKAILDANEFSSDFNFFIGPRKSTISPWSSKTQDIVQNVGIKNIFRIEKFIGFALENINEKNDLNFDTLFDRMTQSLFSEEEIKSFFQKQPQRQLNIINVIENGQAALMAANEEFGFALSSAEIKYLLDFYEKQDRNPTDAELMMFSQANSEHCRHKIFNTKWFIDGIEQENSLFDLIKKTSSSSPKGLISAYKDNAAVISGTCVEKLSIRNNKFEASPEKVNTTIKVETHNHPTAISPYPGASTGSGGEIRDEGATGMGAKPKVGLVGFNVSNLRIPSLPKSWEGKEFKPERIASPLEIMIEAPIGAAAFNNEFGRPNILGYFRSLETAPENGKFFGYHKPIMLAGGIGEILDRNNFKKDIAEDYLIIVLGGPSMLIGLGGGAASSMSSGESDEDLDFASVQRDNAEMERRCQEVINFCNSEDPSIIEFIHDVGAGGLSNAIPELAKDSNHGVFIHLEKIPCADESMSPMEIWSNESQERYVIAINKDNEKVFEAICQRERCPFAVVGTTIEEKTIKLFDQIKNEYPVDVPLEMLFGDLPLDPKNVTTINPIQQPFIQHKTLEEALSDPTIASKSFLITIGDRTVGGMTARDQFIGKWQVPTSNYAMALRSFDSFEGEAIAIGEKPHFAMVDAAASMRMAMSEAIMNLVSVPISSLSNIKVSANWMSATGNNVDDLNLRLGVQALSDFCVDLNIAIPVGKDSLSMSTTWDSEEHSFEVNSPLSGIITAVANVNDVRQAITTEYQNTAHPLLAYVFPDENLALEKNAIPDISPDAIKSMFDFLQENIRNKSILALHDVSDGGLLCCLSELCFTNKIGITWEVANNSSTDEIFTPEEQLKLFPFAETIGAVIQIDAKNYNLLRSSAKQMDISMCQVGKPVGKRISIKTENNNVILDKCITDLERAWSQTSYHIKAMRDNKDDALAEFDLISDTDHKGLFTSDTFQMSQPKNSIFNFLKKKPKVAILREQGINGQFEMAAAFMAAGFEAVDVHMDDLIKNRMTLGDFQGLAACGGFSYGDVLGAGKGWANSILFNDRLNDEFASFFHNDKKFTLGVCNGCQMLSNLKSIIPGTQYWPTFVKNHSDQFEARLAQVKIQKSSSILFAGMEDWSLPIACAHGEGQAAFDKSNDLKILDEQNQVFMNFVNSNGNSTEQYPLNPNGSVMGITGVANQDGRVSILMPHPERVFRSIQFSWKPSHWKEYSPWMQIFINAKKFC